MASQIQDVQISPLERILSQVGRGLAAAQRELDQSSLATQIALDSDPVARSLGLRATWYHMPEVDVNLKLTFNLRREDRVENARFVRRFKMYASPLNATHQNTFRTEGTGTSEIRARIVSIPAASGNG